MKLKKEGKDERDSEREGTEYMNAEGKKERKRGTEEEEQDKETERQAG